MQKRLISEEFSKEQIYLKRARNIVADELSRLALQNSEANSKGQNLCLLAEHFALNIIDLLNDAYPLHYKLIVQHQKSRKDLSLKRSKKTVFPLKSFRGGGKRRTLICRREKIVGSTTLQCRIVPWYHTILCHSGETRTETTLQHSFDGQMDAIAYTTCAQEEPKKRYFYNYKARNRTKSLYKQQSF
jgi:hypothetical protein